MYRDSVVPIGILADPRPSIAAHFVDAELGLPIQHLFSFTWDGNQTGDISRSPGGHNLGDLDTTCLLESFDKLEDRGAIAGAKVDRMVPLKNAVCAHLLGQGSHVTLCQIRHVDKVSDAGTIWSRVIVPKDIKVGQVSTGDPLDVRHQIVWYTLRVLSDQT